MSSICYSWVNPVGTFARQKSFWHVPFLMRFMHGVRSNFLHGLPVELRTAGSIAVCQTLSKFPPRVAGKGRERVGSGSARLLYYRPTLACHANLVLWHLENKLIQHWSMHVFPNMIKGTVCVRGPVPGHLRTNPAPHAPSTD